MSDDDAQFKYWKINGYFIILDCVISDLRSRFSIESLKMGLSIDNFQYPESLYFIEHYEVSKIYSIYVNIRFCF